MFQCSSASRKFLNDARRRRRDYGAYVVSVLFSEPKIPQSKRGRGLTSHSLSVSVLFSEPKIPQSLRRTKRHNSNGKFQCSSASRKFLNVLCNMPTRIPGAVSVLFSEPKIPQSSEAAHTTAMAGVSVLFSEPKIPQS